MGDINHSYEFPQKFLESVAQVVKDNVKDFLKKTLQQTGFAPPVKSDLQASHLQFVGLTSIIPDAGDLLQYVFQGLPVVKVHTGKGVGQSITPTLNEFGLSAKQFQCGSYR